MKLFFNLKHLVKYVIFVGLVYTILNLIPSQQILSKDVFLIVLVIIGGFIFVDNLYKRDNFQNTNEEDEIEEDEEYEYEEEDDDWVPEEVDEDEEVIIEEDSEESLQELTAGLEDDNEKYNQLLSQYKGNNKDVYDDEEGEAEEPPEEEVKIVNPKNKSDKQQESKSLPIVVSCEGEISKIKSEVFAQMETLQNKVNTLQNKPDNSQKYMNFLIKDLMDLNILTGDDVDNINAKLDSNILTINDIITNLEKIKLSSKPKQRIPSADSGEFAFNELPNSFSQPLGTKDLSLWGTDDYSLLNTDKWQVPMPRPPVCINNNPCKVCPTDEPNGGYPINLKNWNSSRQVSNISINKDWANSQFDSNDKVVSTPAKLLGSGNNQISGGMSMEVPESSEGRKPLASGGGSRNLPQDERKFRF